MALAGVFAVGALAGLAAAPAGGAEPVVLLELFTSQGCSSCPRAERLLSRLGLDDPQRDQVVALEFHVDYWNAGGWKDPFGAHEWTLRQDGYCRALGVADGPYTPQLVVNGRTDFPGGDETRARAAIAAQPLSSGAELKLAARRGEPGRVLVDVGVELAAALDAKDLEVHVALYENGVETPVGAGENAGRTLRNDFIVRRLESAFRLESKAGTRRQKSLAIKLDPDWKPASLGVAALLQDRGSMRVYAAAAVRRIE